MTSPSPDADHEGLAVLAEQAQKKYFALAATYGPDGVGGSEALLGELGSLFAALDAHLRAGGELPAAWANARRPVSLGQRQAARELAGELGSILLTVEELCVLAQKRNHVRGIGDGRSA